MRGRDYDAFVTPPSPSTSRFLVLHDEASTVANSDYCVRHDLTLGASIIRAISCDPNASRRAAWTLTRFPARAHAGLFAKQTEKPTR
jgi:hypothetical protein